jgi:molecular chaperone DnaK
MTRDAESHSDEDKKKKQLAEARNEADTLVYSVEKSLREYGDKVTESEKKEIEEALERCRKIKETSSDAAEIRAAVESLTKASYKIAEHIYKAAGAGAQAGQSAPSEEPKPKAEEDVVEAEFEDVDKKDK